jgi:hypothetical protein
MAGVRLGERVLQAGVALPGAFAILAGKAGLTGRACAVVDTADAATPLEVAAAREGVLIEVAVAQAGLWPYEHASFDLGLLDGNALLAAGDWAFQQRLRDMYRVVRVGGRVLVIFRTSTGLAERLGFGPRGGGPSVEGRRLAVAFGGAGFKPVLAEREGLTFVEGFRPGVI